MHKNEIELMKQTILISIGIFIKSYGLLLFVGTDCKSALSVTEIFSAYLGLRTIYVRDILVNIRAIGLQLYLRRVYFKIKQELFNLE